MKKEQNNFAFIDSQNLNLGIRSCGWQLDWARFRVFLSDKYGKAVIVSGDGDFACLVEHFRQNDKFEYLLVPNQKYSCLLESASAGRFVVLGEMQRKLAFTTRKKPQQD